MKASLIAGAPDGHPGQSKKARVQAVQLSGNGATRSGPSPVNRTLEGVYTDATGSLTYELYLSSTLRKRPPLFVMLHGASQTASDFAIGTRMQEVIDECGGIALFPEQSRSAHPLGSWNWYDTRHQFADGGEPSLIAGLTRRIAAEHGVDPRRIYVAGMSAGAAMAVILGQAFPGIFAAVGVHSGIPKGAAYDLMSALRTMNSGPSPSGSEQADAPHSIPTIVFHGDNDRTVHPLNGAAVLAQALRLGVATPTPVDILSTGPTPMPGGREVTLTTHRRRKKPAHAELWIVHGIGHAWTGGSAKGSYTDESGPDASREMLRFFLSQSPDSERRNDRA